MPQQQMPQQQMPQQQMPQQQMPQQQMPQQQMPQQQMPQQQMPQQQMPQQQMPQQQMPQRQMPEQQMQKKQLIDIDKTFEKEIDNLLNDNIDTKKKYDYKLIIKIIIVICLLIVINNLKLLYLFRNIIPEYLYFILEKYEKIIYYIVIGIIIYFLYYIDYI